MSENKTIAKNTIYLYFRMLLVLGVSLYTSRVILDSLGVVDYGLYNVIGGIVAMLSFLNSCAAGATSRFLTFALGRKNDAQYVYKKIFSAAFIIHTLIALFIIAIGETLGLWYLYNKMVIPPDRMGAAFGVFQISLFNVLISFTQVPYNASIIAHERMGIYAYVGIYEAMAKLLIAYAIYLCSFDKLIVYAILLFAVTASISFFYRYYCVSRFGTDCRLCIVRESLLYKRLLSYSGWDLIGNFAGAARSQGVNLILNLFCGPTVNAARAVAYQVEAGLNAFTANFQTAVRPVIIKHYAAGEVDRAISLVYNTCKYSCLLYSCLAVPIILEASSIIRIWLINPPEYTVPFMQIVLLTYLVVTINISLIIGVHATGDVKRLNIFGGSKIFLELPIIYWVLRSGAEPYWAFVVLLVSSSLVMFVDVYVLRKNIPQVSYRHFIVEVLGKCLGIMAIPTMCAYWIHNLSITIDIIRIILVFLTYNILILPMIYRWGINSSMRMKIKSIIQGKIRYGRNNKTNG